MLCLRRRNVYQHLSKSNRGEIVVNQIVLCRIVTSVNRKHVMECCGAKYGIGGFRRVIRNAELDLSNLLWLVAEKRDIILSWPQKIICTTKCVRTSNSTTVAAAWSVNLVIMTSPTPDARSQTGASLMVRTWNRKVIKSCF